jgi:hypothetical protein
VQVATPPADAEALPAADAVPISFLAQVKQWAFGDEGRSLGFSCAVHLSILGLLSFVAFRPQAKPISAIDAALVDSAGGDGTELDLPGDSSLDEELSSAAATPVDFINLAATVGINPDVIGSADGLVGALGGIGDGEGSGFGGDGSGGMAGKIRVPSTAVTKGSFTVWTDPEVPVPGVKYDIVIQVKVSPGITSYRLRDLTGTVRGTDGYFKAIKYESNRREKVTDGVVQIRVPVPGAAQLIRDTIKIRSAILKEEQTIEIVFGGRGTRKP